MYRLCIAEVQAFVYTNERYLRVHARRLAGWQEEPCTVVVATSFVVVLIGHLDSSLFRVDLDKVCPSGLRISLALFLAVVIATA